ncbi:putative F-box/FBD/LRR-repeat protein At2g05300 [Gastrolobium bilobum]|uniref:putative F-box/FBD/LRR-repeat protein At2g05300 n=1 Tax=Gastrolobium bilobum TaxID=150636 RepID=UPI002AAF966F|nr:putative F-box/FBD/LRR-repeat protein At2g05300 [Gastrolobium bilobum]
MVEGSLGCQKDDEDINESDGDMITKLPDPILQHILLFLPTADAARMSTVSKNWRNLWNSLSVLQFSFNENTQSQSLEEFMSWVDDSLSTLRSLEEKAIIHSFILDLNLVEVRHPFYNNGMHCMTIIDFINDWINLVLKNCVKHLKLVLSNIMYTLPLVIFSSKYLLTLHIEGCSIRRESSFPIDHAPFNCLKELALLRVEASSYIVEKILSFSPLLEKVVFKEIGRMGSLRICNLPRLIYVEVEQKLDERLVIEAPNLRTLILRLNGSVNVYVSDCVTWSSKYGSKFVFEHPRLEILDLCFYICTRIKVACSHLRNMSLSNKGHERPLEIEVDAQKLEQLNYEGYVIPTFNGMESLVKPSVTLKLLLGGRPGLDVAVRSCIEMFNQPMVHLSYLYGQCFKAQEILWPGQVQQVQFDSPPPKVKFLKWSLGSLTPAYAYPYLLDGSLCSCHPAILRVETLPRNREFIKFLCHELLEREENPACCEDETGFRCWRHYLKDVHVEIQSQSETKPKPYTSNALMEVLKYIDTSKEFQFSMNWLPNLMSPFFLFF